MAFSHYSIQQKSTALKLFAVFLATAQKFIMKILYTYMLLVLKYQ